MSNSAYTVSAIMAILILGGGFYIGTQLFGGTSKPLAVDRESISTTTTTRTSEVDNVASSTIGQSVEGRDIIVYTFTNQGTTTPASNAQLHNNSKEKHLLFVGGIHGGYEWNSVVLSWRLIEYLQNKPMAIPDGMTISVIPAANPDAIYDAAGTTGSISATDIPKGIELGAAERFNANGVDLNRNFACNWQPTSFWRGQKVDAGSKPFSEPEARAIRDFVQSHTVSAAVFFHSAAGAVYGAACNKDSISTATQKLLDTYAQASGYRAVNRFDAYPITGDAESWLTKLGIPAVSVELSNHQDVEWERNLSGIKAVIDMYTDTEK